MEREGEGEDIEIQNELLYSVQKEQKAAAKAARFGAHFTLVTPHALTSSIPISEVSLEISRRQLHFISLLVLNGNM